MIDVVLTLILLGPPAVLVALTTVAIWAGVEDEK